MSEERKTIRDKTKLGEVPIKCCANCKGDLFFGFDNGFKCYRLGNVFRTNNNLSRWDFLKSFYCDEWQGEEE